MAEEYTLIAPQNFMGAKFVPLNEVWSAIPSYLKEHTNGPRMEFDALRVRFLSRNFDMAYLDIDVELHAPIPLADKPQCSGPGVMVGNGNRDIGLQSWVKYLELCPRCCRPATLAFSGMGAKEVPPSLFTHHYAKGRYMNG